MLGELYGGANETRFAMDIQDVVGWIDGGNEPQTVRDDNFAPTRLLSLQSRLAAAYKGLAALLMKRGGRDFVSGTPIDLNTYFNNAIDIHHIFPRAWCEKQNLPKDKWNSVINKAPLAAGTNRFISGDAPSIYLRRIEKAKEVPSDSLDEFLASHVIPVPSLRSDDFDAFIRLRAGALLDLIEQATGKAVSGRDSEDTIKAFGAALSLRAPQDRIPGTPWCINACGAEWLTCPLPDFGGERRRCLGAGVRRGFTGAPKAGFKRSESPTLSR